MRSQEKQIVGFQIPPVEVHLSEAIEEVRAFGDPRQSRCAWTTYNNYFVQQLFCTTNLLQLSILTAQWMSNLIVEERWK